MYEKREERTYRKWREGKISRGRYLEEKRKWKEYLEERKEKKRIGIEEIKKGKGYMEVYKKKRR